MAYTLSSAIAWWAKMQPDIVAFNIDGRSTTYREYNQWADRVAVRLITDGVCPGDRVAISAINSLEYCALNQGAIRAGAITFPLNIRYTRPECTEALEDIGCKMLFCDSERHSLLKGLVPLREMAEIAQLRSGPVVKPNMDLDPDWPVVIISTSGSTARPKGVVLTHRTMLGYITEYALEEPAISKGAHVLGIGPMSASSGFVQTNHYTTLGCTFYLESAFEPQRALQILTEEKIAAFGGVTLLFERISALKEFPAADLSNLKVATVGGSSVSKSLLDAWINKGVMIRQVYGQTEAGGVSSIMPSHLTFDQREKFGWGGIFTDHKVVAVDGRECQPGEVGQILIRGPGQMAAYWDDPEASAQTVVDGWIHSGDLGFADENGLITFVDRIKDIIISGGINISSAEVERAIAAFPGVEEVVVFPAPDPKFTETPMAVLYANQTIDISALIEHCNSRLADYKVPRYVVVEKAPLPRLPMGKLAKAALREKYKDATTHLPRVR